MTYKIGYPSHSMVHAYHDRWARLVENTCLSCHLVKHVRDWFASVPGGLEASDARLWTVC